MRLDFQIAFHFNNWLFLLLHLSFWPTKQLKHGAHQGVGSRARALWAMGLTGPWVGKPCIDDEFGLLKLFTNYSKPWTGIESARTNQHLLYIVVNFSLPSESSSSQLLEHLDGLRLPSGDQNAITMTHNPQATVLLSQI